MKKSVMKKVLITVKIVVTILFVLVVNKTIFAQEEGLAGLVPVDLLLWAIGFSIVSVGLQGLRWFQFLKMFGIDVSIGQALRSYLEGILFALITPGRAGELFRGFSLEPEWLKKSSVAVVVERIWATVVLFLVGGICFLFLPGDRGGELYQLGIQLAVIASVMAVFILPYMVKRFLKGARLVRRRLISTFFISILIHILLLVQTAGLLFGRSSVSFANSLVSAGSAFSAMQFMPITMANMGVREFNLYHFISLYLPTGVLEESIRHVVLSTSLIIMISNLIVPAIPGVVILITTRLTGSERRK